MSQLWHNFAKTVRKLLKNSGRACKPDFVRGTTLQQCRVTIIPLAPASRPGSSNLPEGSSFRMICLPTAGRRYAVGSAFAFANALSEPGQLSPPIWSCTSRGLPCPRCCHRGGGLLPHLFTLTRRPHHSRCPEGFPSSYHRVRFAGGIFSVALSVTLPQRQLSPPPQQRPLALPGALPYFAFTKWCPDFPPVPLARNQRSSSSPATSIISRIPWSAAA